MKSLEVQNAYGRSLDNGHGLNDFLLVQLGTRSVQVTDDRGHAGLVAHRGSEVDGLLGVIFGEAAKTFSLFVPIRILDLDCRLTS